MCLCRELCRSHSGARRGMEGRLGGPMFRSGGEIWIVDIVRLIFDGPIRCLMHCNLRLPFRCLASWMFVRHHRSLIRQWCRGGRRAYGHFQYQDLEILKGHGLTSRTFDDGVVHSVLVCQVALEQLLRRYFLRTRLCLRLHDLHCSCVVRGCRGRPSYE